MYDSDRNPGTGPQRVKSVGADFHACHVVYFENSGPGSLQFSSMHALFRQGHELNG